MSRMLSLSDYSVVLKASRRLKIEELAELLKEALARTWDQRRRNFILELLERIRVWGWKQTLKREHIKVIEEMFERYFGESLVDYVQRPIVQFVYSAYETGKFQFSFPLSEKDLNALKILEDYTNFWLKKAESETVEQKMKARLKQYFKEGITLEDLASRLQEDFEGILKERKHYWKTVATHWASTYRNLGTVISYEQAGIQYAKVVAVLDERTTRICRRMHGKIIEVSALVEEKERVLNNLKRKRKEFKPLVEEKDWERFKKITLRTDGEFYRNKQIPKLPPYHFGCRTTTVAFFEPAQKPAWAKEMEKHEVLKNYHWAEIQSKLESIQKLAEEGKLVFPRTRRTYKGYEDSLQAHFEEHKQEDYIKAKDPKDYLRMANETILNATHIAIGYFKSREAREKVPDFRFWDSKNKRYVVLDFDLRILTFHSMSKAKKWRQKTRNAIKLKTMDVEKSKDSQEQERSLPIKDSLRVLRLKSEFFITEGYKRGVDGVWIDEFVYFLSELSDALMEGQKPDQKEWEYLMGLLKEVFERVKKDRELKEDFKYYFDIYTEGETYPESHWWWHALD